MMLMAVLLGFTSMGIRSIICWKYVVYLKCYVPYGFDQMLDGYRCGDDILRNRLYLARKENNGQS